MDAEPSYLYLVLDPDASGVFRVTADPDRADRTALNIDGVVCRVQIVADYRNPATHTKA